MRSARRGWRIGTPSVRVGGRCRGLCLFLSRWLVLEWMTEGEVDLRGEGRGMFIRGAWISRIGLGQFWGERGEGGGGGGEET